MFRLLPEHAAGNPYHGKQRRHSRRDLHRGRTLAHSRLPAQVCLRAVRHPGHDLWHSYIKSAQNILRPGRSTPHIHHPLGNIRHLFQCLREGDLRIAGDEKGVDILGSALLNKVLHLPIHPFRAGGIGRADDDEALGGGQCRPDGICQHTADGQFLRVPEDTPDSLLPLLYQGSGHPKALQPVENTLGNGRIQRLMPVTDKHIIVIFLHITVPPESGAPASG